MHFPRKFASLCVGEPAVPDQYHEGGGHLPQDQVLPHQAAAPGAAIAIVEGVVVLLLVDLCSYGRSKILGWASLLARKGSNLNVVLLNVELEQV